MDGKQIMFFNGNITPGVCGIIAHYISWDGSRCYAKTYAEVTHVMQVIWVRPEETNPI